VTETQVVGDLVVATALLRALRAMGATVAVDDFGSGWAPLTYLSTLRPQVLKLDKDMADGLECSSYQRDVVGGIAA